MLIIKDLCKDYGKVKALDHLDLTIEKGEIFGFVGPNGAGKTTTMKIVSGLLKATSGEVYVDDIDAIHDQVSLKRKIGYMPDFFGVYDNLKAMEYMEFYASMYGIVGRQATETCRDLMELVSLEGKENVYVDSLSRGMKQRLCLARSLVHNPKLLILDEPASGLDPKARIEMKAILKNLGDMGKTIMISSHILSELAEMCNKIGVMEHGVLRLNGDVDEILSHSKGRNPIEITVLEKQESAVRILKEDPLVENISMKDEVIIASFLGTDQEEAELLKKLVMNDVVVKSFVRERGSLETLFLNITNAADEVEELIR